MMHPLDSGTNPFRQLLAPSFDALPPAVRRIHHGSGHILLRGLCKVRRGVSWTSRMMGYCAQLPPSGDDVPVQVRIERKDGRERWARRFGNHRMTSVLSMKNGRLVEALGPVRFIFELQGSEQGIRWMPWRVLALGVPLPIRWFQFDVQERSEQERYVFDVRVALTGVGLLVHYEGWLEIDA